MAPSAIASPPDRSNPAAVQRWLERRSARLAALIARRLTEIVNDAYDRFLRSLPPEDALVAAGDFSQFDSIPGLWADVISEEIDPEITATYLSAARGQFDASPTAGRMPIARAEAFARVINDQAAAYALTARNRLVGVGDAVYRHISGATASAIRSGASNEALKDLIEKNTRFSEYRADTIARTEILNAYGNGDWASASALGEFGPMEKTWLATGDARTRPEHLALDGETLPMDEPFDAGGEPMMFPHDPGASAGNVVNCRCILNFLYAGDERPDGTIVGASDVEGEILAEETMLEQEQAADLPESFSTIDEEIAFANSQRAAGITVEDLPDAEQAIIDYTNGSGWYSTINTSLRDPEFADTLSAGRLAIRDEYVRQIDSLIEASPGLESPIVTYRGVKAGEFADLIATLQPGDTLSDAGFMSTSTRRSIADRFARTDGTVIEVISPAGTKGVVPIGYRAEITPELAARAEMEWLLPRNSTLRVVSRTADRIVVEVVQ